LACVDRVVLFDEDTPLELITALQPDVLVKGGDYQLNEIVGREIVLARGGQVVALPFLPGYSTTALLERLRRAKAGSK
jgi:bifunctional ADP-heptose synthase (sugar kinase/adenylyltransferase)